LYYDLDKAIPVTENEYYNASLYISSKDVNQLDSKFYYFHSNKKKLMPRQMYAIKRNPSCLDK
jgi:hypothetical protein